MRRRRGRWTRTRIVSALPALLLLGGCTDQGPVEPAREEAGEGFLSAEEAAALEGTTPSASREADVTVTDGEVCHLIDFDEACDRCEPEAPPGSGISFSQFPDNWWALEWPFAPSQPNIAIVPGHWSVPHIHFDPPASRVDLLFSTFGSFTLEAQDGTGQVLASESVPVNTNDGSDWDPLGIDLGGNVIAQVILNGAGNARTGFDNLEVCHQQYVPVEIDIKPGSDPDAVNPESRGVLPVAVLSAQTAAGESVDLDAADADPATITLGDGADPDAPIAERRNGHLMASLEDVDEDSDRDLVVHFETQALVDNGDLDEDTEELVLAGETDDGMPIQGDDDVKVVGGGP